MRYFSLVAIFALVASLAAPPAGAVQTTALASRLQRIYTTAYGEVLSRHAFARRDGTTYVSTGDIPADWLRDSSAIAMPYIEFARSDRHTARLLRGIIARQATYVLIDPYANAFNSSYRVAERKFEIDSLLYPIWFAYRYWQITGDRSVFTHRVQRSYERILHVMHVERNHADRSRYRHSQLAGNGSGSPVRATGMIWDGFRPSDDPCRYQYNIPENMFAAVVLRELTTIERNVYHDERDAADAWGLSVGIQRGIERYGTVFLPGFGRIYAYEVDGLGHANVMDDANVPSLLSSPYFGYLSKDDATYQATRRFVLSPRNPYFFTGHYAQGVGSPHTPRGYVWPLALIVQALTARNETERNRVMRYLASSDTGDHRLHESFDVNRPWRYTRSDFAWPNAMYQAMYQELLRS